GLVIGLGFLEGHVPPERPCEDLLQVLLYRSDLRPVGKGDPDRRHRRARLRRLGVGGPEGEEVTPLPGVFGSPDLPGRAVPARELPVPEQPPGRNLGEVQWSTVLRCGLTDDFSVPCWSVRRIPTREADAVRKLTFGMNLSLDGYIAAPGDDIGWSVPSDELFQWWSDRVGATGLALYGRKLWETMSSHWPTADQQPGATPAEAEFARR